MMPNKKNPDPAELVRGRTPAVSAALGALLGLLKGLPLAYQRDLQEDKRPLFESVATLDASLRVMAGLLDTLVVDTDAMRAATEDGATTATAVADALVRRGVPFRTAHHVVGGFVARAEADGLALGELADETIADGLRASDDATARSLAADPEAPGALRMAAAIEAALAACDVVGGTAPDRVRAALAEAEARLSTA